MKLLLGSDRVTAAKNIRIELKAAFPGVKFSVTGRCFSGGDSIDVSWTDGPLAEEVNKITKKYQDGSFNGMEDIYEYNKDNSFTNAHGSAKYVQTHREMSDEARAVIIAKIEERTGKPFNMNYDYNEGKGGGAMWGSMLIYRYLVEAI